MIDWKWGMKKRQVSKKKKPKNPPKCLAWGNAISETGNTTDRAVCKVRDWRE